MYLADPFLIILFILCHDMQVIEGLDSCKKLTILHLYSNCISQITNVGHLRDLEVLGLAQNNIINIEVWDAYI